jgi:hypothetical protein
MVRGILAAIGETGLQTEVYTTEHGKRSIRFPPGDHTPEQRELAFHMKLMAFAHPRIFGKLVQALDRTSAATLADAADRITAEARQHAGVAHHG